NEISAVVDMIYKAGVLEEGKDPKFENNVKGLVEAINYTVDKYYKEAYYGWQFNIWAYSGQGVPGQGLLHQTEYLGWDKGREFIKDAATKTAEYYENSGITSYGADFISIDKYGLDGAYETGAPEDPEKSRWFWNADIWDNYLFYTKTLSDVTNLPAVLWQIPVGHINNSQTMSPYDNEAFAELKNVAGSYEDSATTYFFGDTFKAGNAKRLEYFSKNEAKDPKVTVKGDTITWGSHMEEVRDSNIVSVLFGAGVGASTDAVGSPPTDDYFWITKAQYYYDKVVMLAGGKPVEKPLKPEVIVDKTENDGNYNVKLEIPKDSKATDYKLYENNKVIKEGAVTSEKLTVSVDMKDKAEGEYIYKAELKNKDGITTSISVKVIVKKDVVVPQEKPKKPSISVDKAQNKGDYKVTGTISKDSNGKTFKLYENAKVIEEGVVSKEEKIITKDFKGKAVGKYTYKIELINEVGVTTSETIEVVVEKDEVTPPSVGDTYDSNKVYNTGDKVIYKGKEYTAKWWVKGEAPDKSAAWEVTPETGADGTQIYVPGKAYNGGDVVSYNGTKYKAKWWTNTVPGSDESWSKV
ncbi:MAG: carbohydrate-binding protein, partial [Clostridium sp.]|uniref:carbohydrate-binding protein n=1 Tax=Clostridium sp. TaxID=1506 RepID=UPI003F339BB1